MTSKEAVTNLRNRFGDNGWGFKIEEVLKIIEKDLEILEMIKNQMEIKEVNNYGKNTEIIEFLGWIGNEDDKEDFYKIKEWLEK